MPAARAGAQKVTTPDSDGHGASVHSCTHRADGPNLIL